jgi:glycosyltransferase involved in cell wall biosynthesis
VADVYGIDADVVPPPVDIDVYGPTRPVAGVEPGFLLCVSRLLAYKNVGAVVEAFAIRPDRRLVVVGSGPLAEELAAAAPSNVTLVGRVDDDELRWLYRSCRGLIAASYEDFGLTPVEAAGFGAPTAALRWGGFLDTIVDGSTGCFFDEPTPEQIAAAVDQLVGGTWSTETLAGHAEQYRPERFAARIAEVVDEVRRSR